MADPYKWTKQDEKDRKGMLKFAETFGKFTKLAFANPKTQKGVVNTEKMFKAIKASGETVVSVLDAFVGAGAGKDLFKSVVTEYSNYLSLTFWGEIMKSIDWSAVNKVVTESLAPAFENIGEAIGNILETPVVSNAITDASNLLVFGLESIGALFTGDWTKVLDMAEDVQWLVDFRTNWNSFWDTFFTVSGFPDLIGPTEAELERERIYAEALLNEQIESLEYATPESGVGEELGVDYLTGKVATTLPTTEYTEEEYATMMADRYTAARDAEILAQETQQELLYETKITNERLEAIIAREDYRYR